IVADKKIPNKLVVSDYIEKILEIDDTILGTYAGFIPDGRVLIDYARHIAQEYKVTYGKNIEVDLLVREISDIMHLDTRYSGVRPFGVSLIIGGIDKTGIPKLYILDPAGIFYRTLGTVIGEGEDKILKILEENYKEMKTEEAIRYGIDLLKELLKDNFTYERTIVGYVKVGEKVKILQNHQIKEFYEG
ncbi:MAG: proteasome subunit alpha, partial [Nanopusillaceae archaeon]